MFKSLATSEDRIDWAIYIVSAVRVNTQGESRQIVVTFTGLSREEVIQRSLIDILSMDRRDYVVFLKYREMYAAKDFSYSVIVAVFGSKLKILQTRKDDPGCYVFGRNFETRTEL